jgi:ubiquinone/menaquinone biosynthesis C-methylase UbiE
MLMVAQSRLARVAFLTRADAHDLPFRTGAFDAVVSSSVMHHWQQPRLAFAEIRRVLKPGGTLTLTAWDRGHLPTRLRDAMLRITDPAHNRACTAPECAWLIRDAGMTPGNAVRYAAGWGWGLLTIKATAG